MESGKHILVVEDELPIAKALQLKLESIGAEVDVASNGKEGLSKLRADGAHYDAMLLDLVMPVMDGFTVLEQMKELGIQTPAIVSTNLSQDDDVARAKELGAADYYVKSNTPISEVVSVVEKLIAA